MIARTVTAAALAGTLGLLGVPGPLGPAPASATTVAPSHTELASEVPVALQRVGAGLLLLTDHPATAAAPGVQGRLEARAGIVSGAVVHWTTPIDLSGAWQVYDDAVRTDTASNGLTAIAWDGIDTSQVDPQDPAAVATGAGQAVVVVVRAPNGSWQGPYSTGQITRLTAVTADAAGDVAVLGQDAQGRQKTLVRTPSGDWSVVPSARLRLASIHLDGRGVIHGVVHRHARGGDGTVALTRLATGATAWSRPKPVRAAGPRVQDVQLLVDDAGQETLVVGSDSPHWASTTRTGGLFSTAYQVLQRVHGRFRSLWQRDGAQQLSAALGADGRLQLLWVQDHQPNRRHRPTRFRLVTQQLAPTAGPVVTLTAGTTYRSDGTRRGVGADALFLGTGAGASGVGALWVDRQALHVWWNGGSAVLPTTPGPAAPAGSEGPLGAVGAISTAPVVAWVSASTGDGRGGYATAATSVAEVLP